MRKQMISVLLALGAMGGLAACTPAPESLRLVTIESPDTGLSLRELPPQTGGSATTTLERPPTEVEEPEEIEEETELVGEEAEGEEAEAAEEGEAPAAPEGEAEGEES